MGGFHIMGSSRWKGHWCFFTYQTTDMPLLSTLYEPLSKQLISVLDGRLGIKSACSGLGYLVL